TSRLRDWDEVDAGEVETVVQGFVDEACERLETEGYDDENIVLETSLDMRYAGQSFSLSVDVPAELDETALEHAEDEFHRKHRRRYGHAYDDEPLELVTVRLRARGVVEPPSLSDVCNCNDGTLEDAVKEERPVVFDEIHDTRVYERSRLPEGEEFEGSAIVEGGETTLVVPPGQRARVDDYGNILVEVDG
ncbi:MAG: hydantoinase/oxoprolinase family protein, partial [Halobacteria archaeon]|nr:hydantoinase/oxoprolinase family protein [Halobacteria archaeon]